MLRQLTCACTEPSILCRSVHRQRRCASPDYLGFEAPVDVYSAWTEPAYALPPFPPIVGTLHCMYLPYTLMMHRMHDLLLMTPTLLAHRSHMLGPCCQTSDRNSIIPWKHAVSNIQHRWCDRHIDSNPCLECTHDVGNVQHVCKLQGSYGCSGNIAGATRTCST